MSKPWTEKFVISPPAVLAVWTDATSLRAALLPAHKLLGATQRKPHTRGLGLADRPPKSADPLRTPTASSTP